MTTMHASFDLLAIRAAAALEGVDVRSVLKRLCGGVVRGVAGVRADRAIARLRNPDRPASSPLSAA